MEKGLFIVIEGIDGSGKSTLIKNLLGHIYQRNKRFDDLIVTREPTYGRYGKHAREILMQDGDPMTNRELALDYFIKDRIEHHARLIEPALLRGAIVLCDRERFSTTAYQGAQGISIEKIVGMHKMMLSPDVVLLATCSPDLALRRRLDELAKQQPGSVTVEKFEQLEFQKKVAVLYARCGELFPHIPVKMINTESNRDESLQQALSALEAYLPYKQE